MVDSIIILHTEDSLTHTPQTAKQQFGTRGLPNIVKRQRDFLSLHSTVVF